ncbi:MAG: trypsin-like peptidase domain-containing protein [Saprospiraceae bacterium]|nr:trypsin-like peptidase domain-containing protein [Saprospiraceae bacterium]
MKKLLSLLASGVIGGLVVLAGFLLLAPNAEEATQNNARLTSAEAIVSAPSSFKHAADIAMPAVVHISASESSDLAAKRYGNQRRSPFDLFFGENDMMDFFGGGAPRQREGKGSGVIISPDGYIVTNNHVIDYADQFEVTLHDDRKFGATLIGKDPRTDLAVIKVDADDLPFLKFGDSDDIEVGEWVLAVGNPFDLTSTVTAGIVSAKGREKIIRRRDAIEDFIQTDAVVNPGNSGGALVNTNGELIGINTAIATATGYYAGYSFAIPSNMLEGVVDNIIEFGGPRGRLGVSITSVSAFEEYQETKLAVNEGAVITEVEDGSAAQYAGLIPEDVITRMDGEKVTDPDQLITRLSKKKIGDEVKLTLVRDGQKQHVTVALKAS